MGYDIHITRKENWFDEDGSDISSSEWLSYVESDAEMRLDGYAEANLKDGSVLRAEDPSMAVWIAHSQHDKRDGMAWIWLSQGNIQAKNPDKETLRKMWRIAQALGAKVQGDDCEFYDSDGSRVRAPASEQPSAALKKPWWRVW